MVTLVFWGVTAVLLKVFVQALRVEILLSWVLNTRWIVRGCEMVKICCAVVEMSFEKVVVSANIDEHRPETTKSRSFTYYIRRTCSVWAATHRRSNIFLWANSGCGGVILAIQKSVADRAKLCIAISYTQRSTIKT